VWGSVVSIPVQKIQGAHYRQLHTRQRQEGHRRHLAPATQTWIAQPEQAISSGHTWERTSQPRCPGPQAIQPFAPVSISTRRLTLPRDVVVTFPMMATVARPRDIARVTRDWMTIHQLRQLGQRDVMIPIRRRLIDVTAAVRPTRRLHTHHDTIQRRRRPLSHQLIQHHAANAVSKSIECRVIWSAACPQFCPVIIRRAPPEQPPPTTPPRPLIVGPL